MNIGTTISSCTSPKAAVAIALYTYSFRSLGLKVVASAKSTIQRYSSGTAESTRVCVMECTSTSQSLLKLGAKHGIVPRRRLKKSGTAHLIRHPLWRTRSIRDSSIVKLWEASGKSCARPMKIMLTVSVRYARNPRRERRMSHIKSQS